MAIVDASRLAPPSAFAREEGKKAKCELPHRVPCRSWTRNIRPEDDAGLVRY